jgi:flagellar hook protein FlgE
VQQKFSVNAMTQNGLPAGRLTGIDIDDEGVILPASVTVARKPSEKSR